MAWMLLHTRNKGETTMTECTKNTDKEIWRAIPGDYYSDSIHITENGMIGINCGGHVIVSSIRDWHNALDYVDKIEKELAEMANKNKLLEETMEVIMSLKCSECNAKQFAFYAWNKSKEKQP
jgi:hypothetical protein